MRSRETLLRLHRFKTEDKRRQVAEIDGMIQEFMRKYDDLDAQVRIEESRNGVSDPNHFNYSLAAKAARGRRDNLMRSIAELKDQLNDAQSALADEERELRRAELLVEKEGGSTAAVAGGTQATVSGIHAR
ncbi:MAG: flagellar export protein FliJ [Rhizobiales bacterium]|nr:flagellar export protein FliJ [Hyphomicrobiales bacterium]